MSMKIVFARREYIAVLDSVSARGLCLSRRCWDGLKSCHVESYMR